MLRWHTCRTCGHLHVLRIERGDHIGRSKLVGGHFLRVHPDTHTEIISKPVDAAHTRHTQQGILHKYVGIIIEKSNVVGILWRIYGHHHQHTGVNGAYRKAQAAHHRRQKWCGNAHTVLYIQRSHINVSAYVEGHIHRHQAVVGAVALHVFHAGCTVHLFFHRCGHCLLHRLGIGAGKLAIHLHNRRRNIRILINRQVEYAYSTRKHQHNGYDDSSYRPFDECIRDHGN